MNRLPGIPEYCAFNGSYFPARPESKWAIGLDLGTQCDYTALAAVNARREPLQPGVDGWVDTDLRPQLGSVKYLLRDLRRFDLGLSYTQIADKVLKLMTGPLRGVPLVVDATGVGKPVVDLLEQKGLTNVVPVLITAGHTESRDGKTLHVPKRTLIGHLEAALHLKELKIAAQLSEGQALAQELADFRATYTESGNLSMNARSGAHDDLILSVALALFYLRRSPGNRWAIQTINL